MTRGYEIIDGQQRINAITRFVENGIKLFDMTNQKVTGLPRFLKSQACPWGGKTFETLPKEVQDEFLSRQVQVAVIKSQDQNEIRELFVRLQQGLPLNAQEKRDAWPGAFTDFVIKTAGKSPNVYGHDFFSKVLKAPNKNRGGERQACAQLYMTLQARRETSHVETFVDLNSTQIDEFYRHHLDIDSSDPLLKRFRDILDVAVDILGDKKRKPIQFHIALHTILMIDTLMSDFTNAWKRAYPKALDKFLAELISATQLAKSGDASSNPYWIHYGLHARTNSTAKDTIRVRHRFFVKSMLDLMGSLPRIDPKRGFSTAERELLYLSQEKTCKICNAMIDWNEAEVHHLEPHSDGGATVLSNAVVVCRRCHPRGPNAHGPDRMVLDIEKAVSAPNQPDWAITRDESFPELTDEEFDTLMNI